MMGRPTDWSPVGLASDPIPGDPLQISGAVQRYRSTAEAIAAASANLRRLDGSALVSEAFQVAFERIQDVAGKLDSTESRVRGAADALDRYWPELDRAQADSLRELHQAEAQKADAKRYADQVSSIANAYNSSSDPTYRASLVTPYQTAVHGNSTASHAVAEARRRIQDAIDARDLAAQTAISTLDDADALSPVKDTAWDKVSDWYEKNVLPIIKTVVKSVSDFADKWGTVIDVIGAVLSIAALFIPGVGIIVSGCIGMAFSDLSMAFSACKIVNAGFELQDGRMTPDEYKAVCLTEGVSIGLSVVMIGLSAFDLAGAGTVARVGVKQLVKTAAKSAATEAGKDAVEFGADQAIDSTMKTQGEQRLQQERLDQEQRMIKVRQDYEQGRTSDSYTRQLTSSDLALAV